MRAVAPTAVYLLCLLTSTVCSVLLLRAYFRDRSRLLLWTAAAFVFFAVNNLLLVADMIFLPTVDLWLWRQIAAAAALFVLIYGFVMEVES